MSWKGLRHKGTEILTSREWNLSVDALDELYGMLTAGTSTISVETLNAREGNFSEAVLVQGRPVIKDGDPIQIYQFYDIAVSQITRAVDEAKVTEYARETRDVAVKLRMDEYGNIGVVIAEPLDEYGNITTSLRADTVGIAKEETLRRIANALGSVGVDSFITMTRLQKRIEDGYAFSVSHRFESVGSDEVVTMYFENPSDSGRTVYVVVVEVTSLAQAWVDVYRNVTPSGGTSITPVNLNFAEDIPSAAIVKYGVTFEGGVHVTKLVCPGGSRVNAVGGAVEVGESVIVPPGYNVLIAVTNKSGSATDLSIRIIWWEE